MAVGGRVTITTLPGYLPIQSDPRMLDVYHTNAATLVGKEQVKQLGHRTGSTDMGDVSQIMPVIHPYVVAATGRGHGEDYVVQDYNLAVLTGAKAMAMTVIDLLANDAARAREVVGTYRAPMTKQSYLSFMRSLLKEETYTE
jgi:metal-dependent amidase/aminoacylase/carboxypeptidase family protein